MRTPSKTVWKDRGRGLRKEPYGIPGIIRLDLDKDPAKETEKLSGRTGRKRARRGQ